MPAAYALLHNLALGALIRQAGNPESACIYLAGFLAGHEHHHGYLLSV